MAIRKATRVVVISDLHLGGGARPMVSRPGRLERFLSGLQQRLAPDERLHLIIAGDFVDFLAATPWRAFTADPAEAREKLEGTARDPRYAGIFAALAALVRAGTPIDLLIGNHDLELALPQVGEALLGILGATPRQVTIHADGSALRLGGLLIEHGNRYDGANANDWTDLRAIASALSRFETPRHRLEPSPGSRLVAEVINPIKERYPFVDLLKPQGELTALLLFAFEPALARHMEPIGKLLEGARRRGLDRRSTQHARSQIEEHDEQLAAVFGTSYAALRRPPEHAGAHLWIDMAAARDRNGIAARLQRGEAIPARQLEAIRLGLERLLLDDRSAAPDGPVGAQGEAAAAMIEESGGAIAMVVMGHTHLPRHLGPQDRARYVNSGTWADVVRVPSEAMSDDDALRAFLLDLHEDRRPASPANFADIRLSADGEVESARLAAFE